MDEVVIYLEDQGSSPILVIHYRKNRNIVKEERFCFDRAHVSKELLDNSTVKVVE